MKKIKSVTALGMLMMLLVSCASIPLPGSPTESLFVLCGDLERDLGTDGNGGHSLESIRVTLVQVDTGKKKDLVFYPSKSFISTTLEPGKYMFNNQITLSLRWKGSSHTKTRTEYIQTSPFLIEPNTVFISPVLIKVIGRRGWYSYTSYYSTSTSNVLKKGSVEDLFAQRRYKAWELYQLIGWEISEE
ncbi:MAG: hypothetical protein PQJ58_04390 [Spirochaetales bacterium]|nr:hypothetical protein [Spirochaetales bacterium]